MNLLRIGLMALTPVLCFAQSPHPEAIPARILDASLILPNYRWALDVRAQNALEDVFGEEQWERISALTQDKTWPTGLRSLQDREENRHWFCEFHAYYLHSFGLDHALLWIPARENSHLPPQLRPERDWYVVIRQSAFEKLDNRTERFPVSLEAQLDFLLRDCLNGFAQSLQKEDPLSPSSLEGKEIPAIFLLEGTRSSTFIRSLEGNRLTLIANYPPYGSRDEALSQYRQLLQRLQSARLSACPLAKGREFAQSNGILQTNFTAFDYAGDMDPRYKGLTLEVRLNQTYSQAGSTPVWFVQIVLLP